jgi:hypothetical protein
MTRVFRITEAEPIMAEPRRDSAGPDAHQDALEQIRDWLAETERQEQAERAWERAWQKLIDDWNAKKAAERDAFRQRLTGGSR